MKVTVCSLCVAYLCVAAGCAPTVMNARQVGDASDSTWVYLQAKDEDESGIYRCTATKTEPVCVQAKVEDR